MTLPREKEPMDPDIHIIDTMPALEAAAGRLGGEPVLAVDMEADSLFHYREKVCLLQIATPESTLVIDPLALAHLEPLKPVFANPKIRKVFHGADYDIRSLYRDFNIEVRHLFDTELACRFLGHERSGLDAVLAHYFGVELDKRYQKKDWSERPLPEEMILYAARDTAYLIGLSEILRGKLKRKRRLGWVEQECQMLSGVRPGEDSQGPFFLRFKGAGRLRRGELALLEALLTWRDQTAQKKDRPPFKVLGGQEILRIVETDPKDLQDLMKSGILSPRQTKMFARELSAVIEGVHDLPGQTLPVFPRQKRKPAPGNDALRRMEALKNWRDRKAEKLGLDPALLMNKEALAAVAAIDPLDLDRLLAAGALKPWQQRAFSKEIVKILSVAK